MRTHTIPQHNNATAVRPATAAQGINPTACTTHHSHMQAPPARPRRAAPCTNTPHSG